MKLNVLSYPNPKLREVAQPVTEFDDKLQKIVDDMLETMYADEGIGLAATQVGINKSIIVIDLTGYKGNKNPQVFINLEYQPDINSPLETIKEGCLSVPGFAIPVTRHQKITYNALDRHGKPFCNNKNDDPFLARCLQHEHDHLIGKLSVDYASSLKRGRIKKKLEKLQRLASKA